MRQVCNRFMRNCTQIAEKERSPSVGEGDELSSYGSGHSSEGYLEPHTIPAPTSGEDDLPTLVAGIAALSRGQAIVLEKLTFLEKIVGTVQFDMTWVRDDMKSVQQVMERIGSHVSDIRDAAAEADRHEEQAPVERGPRQAMKGKEQVEVYMRPPSLSTSLVERACRGGDVPQSNAAGKGGGNCIQDMEPFANNISMHTNTVAIVESGRRDWGYTRRASPELGSPPCSQPRVRPEKEAVEEESEQVEMSCQSTQQATPATESSMWSSFSAAVRDWPPPTQTRSRREEGWMSAKKGRWGLAEYGNENDETMDLAMLEEPVALNLNLLPEKEGTTAAWVGGCDAAPPACVASASKNGSSGAWRGTARGRRPPAAQPRYHTSVRVGTP